GVAMVKAGVNGRKIHAAIHKFFEDKGYPTGVKAGHNQGFFHGTGHGIGLEIHEEPVRINWKNFILKKGHVTSVEPGLYYSDIGGVRIEDLVYVTGTGCKVLAHFPKQLEIL
ncbi:MAG: M24 family metallopeptidase, partial [Pseudomonadota bacterium]